MVLVALVPALLASLTLVITHLSAYHTHYVPLANLNADYFFCGDMLLLEDQLCERPGDIFCL